MRSSSIWIPLFIAGAAAGVTVAVLSQRHARSAARAEKAEKAADHRLSPPASAGPESESMAKNRMTESSFAERLRADARAPRQPLGFDPEPPSTLDLGGEETPGNIEQGEAYDAVSADDLGAEWLARATESLSAHSPSPFRGEFDELTTVDLLDEDPSSLPAIELEPDSKFEPDRERAREAKNAPDGSRQASQASSDGKVESEVLLGDATPELANAAERPRPPPGIFDIAELTQEEDAPPGRRRRSS